MGLFSDPGDAERREKLKQLEDKRLAFAQMLANRGFKPETMLFAQTENGGFTALAKFGGKQWLVISPGLGTDEDFRLETQARFDVRKEEILVKSEGMGGMLGFGKKGERGVDYVFALPDGGEAHLPFVFGRSCWAEYAFKKNPLLGLKRRRGNANVVWDLKPVDNTELDRIVALADSYLE
ncbi:MAG: hypothetical protein IJH86_05395 [Clostridia bacterium]|nr:hypothetical protein [Clostridia bacterium]